MGKCATEWGARRREPCCQRESKWRADIISRFMASSAAEKTSVFISFEQFPFGYKVSWKDISLFFDPKGPLWCLIDLYGSCSAIELEETSTVEETQDEPGQSVEATAPPMTPDTYRTISTTTFDRQLTPPPSYENLFSYRGNTWTAVLMLSLNIFQLICSICTNDEYELCIRLNTNYSSQICLGLICQVAENYSICNIWNEIILL